MAPADPPSLDTLNPAEREVLALLAQGHTAKTIVAATGRSVGAVNERLREARRKTGVGSSRELARLLARESRDRIIGLAPPAGTPQPGGVAAPLGVPPARKERSIVMTLLTGGALAALLAVQSTPAPADGDPRLARVLPAGQKTPRDYHDQLLAEMRDPAWAAGQESALRTGYGQVPGVEALRVTCARTVCEVLGEIRGEPARADAAMQGVQGGTLFRALQARGLVNATSVFGSDRLFVAYWERKG